MTTNTNTVPMRHIPRWTFADRVRKIRRDSGLNQTDFADRLGVGDRALAAWESGRTMPRDVVAIANDIWKQFRVPPTWTLGLEDSYGGPPDGGGENGEVTPVTGELYRLPPQQVTSVLSPDSIAATLTLPQLLCAAPQSAAADHADEQGDRCRRGGYLQMVPDLLRSVYGPAGVGAGHGHRVRAHRMVRRSYVRPADHRCRAGLGACGGAGGPLSPSLHPLRGGADQPGSGCSRAGMVYA